MYVADSWVPDFVSVVHDAIQTTIDYMCALHAECQVCVLRMYIPIGLNYMYMYACASNTDIIRYV